VVKAGPEGAQNAFFFLEGMNIILFFYFFFHFSFIIHMCIQEADKEESRCHRNYLKASDF
jgi:hypothetical protein